MNIYYLFVGLSGSAKMAKILHLSISGMTCGKCEKLIKEGVIGEVSGATDIQIDREGGKAKIFLNYASENEVAKSKEKILSIINSLVNGKFQASIDQGC